MDRETLSCLRKKVKDTMDYMKNIEKIYLKGNRLEDKIELVKKIYESHSPEELDYLYNDLVSQKEGDIYFSSAYTGIVLPIFAMIITVFGGFFAAMSGFLNQFGMKMADIYIKKMSGNNQSIENFMSGMGKTYTTIYSKISDKLYFAIFIILLFLMGFLLYYSFKLRRKKKYISYLQSAKDLYNINEDKYKSETD